MCSTLPSPQRHASHAAGPACVAVGAAVCSICRCCPVLRLLHMHPPRWHAAAPVLRPRIPGAAQQVHHIPRHVSTQEFIFTPAGFESGTGQGSRFQSVRDVRWARRRSEASWYCLPRDCLHLCPLSWPQTCSQDRGSRSAFAGVRQAIHACLLADNEGVMDREVCQHTQQGLPQLMVLALC